MAVATSSNGQYGSALAMNAAGTVFLAVGAPEEEGPGGAVCLYDNDSGKLLHELTAARKWEQIASFDISVALNNEGTRLLLGAAWLDNKTHLYDVQSGDLLQTFSQKPSSDWFGWAVDISSENDDVCVIGARSDHASNDHGGAV